MLTHKARLTHVPVVAHHLTQKHSPQNVQLNNDLPHSKTAMPDVKPLHEFETLIARPEATAAAFRTTVVAHNLDDAMELLAIQHGQNNVLSVWNEHATTKPRDEGENVQQPNDHKT